MRVKLVFLAASLALVVTALVFGADTCAQIGTQQQNVAEQGAQQPEDGQKVEDPRRDGVQNVNRNLGKMKSGMQEQMNQRRDQLDERIEGSTQ